MEDVVMAESFWLDRPTFVTGATGMLGGWLVRRLIALNADIVCLVRDDIPKGDFERSGSSKQVAVVRGDVTDQALLERILGEYEIKSVFHLAAQTIVGVANRNPVSTFSTNIGGTWSILEAARRSPVTQDIVVASSDKAYGSHPTLPYTEDMGLQGRHPYDVTKSAADLIAQSYAITYGLPVAISRCGNLYGGGDLNWNRIVPGTIRSVLRGERPIIRSDGSYIRDYLYVEDAVDAYLALAEELSSDIELIGEPFNVSTGEPVSVTEITKRIIELMESDLVLDIRGEASNEIREQHLNSDKARQRLNWSPVHNLNSGLLKTVDWYRRYFNQLNDA